MVQVTCHEINGISLTVQSRSPSQEIYPPVVLLPGTAATATDWDKVVADLSWDRRAHAVDLRGHGHSQWPGVYSIDLMAADLAALLPGLGAQVDLIGHSLGGLVACRTIAAGAPEPRKLVLEDVGLLHPRTPATPARPEGDLGFDWAMVEQVRPEIDNPAPHWRDTLAQIAIPTLAIGGGPASFLPQEHVAELVSLVQRGRQVTIDAGHCIHAAKPAQFLDAVHDFLDA
ncbi:MAG: alpha/beta fold hydrolase [Nocardioidaceae bacterium]